MDTEERFDISEDEFLKFDRIPENERRHSRPDVCAMVYLHERLGGEHNIIAGADHDIVWLECDPEKLTDADIVYLQRCGCHYDSESDSLAMFV